MWQKASRTKVRGTFIQRSMGPDILIQILGEIRRSLHEMLKS